MIPYNLLISCFIYIRPFHAIRIYTTIFENAPLHCANPYIPLISCNLILLIIHYHFKKSTLIEWIHTLYWSTVSFTSDLSPLSDSTLLFSKMPHPTVQIHTFRRLAAIWFYWLYTIIKKPPFVEQFRTINKSTVSFTSYLYIYFRQFLLQSLTWQA